jgi:hypothetical protein
MMKLKGTKKQSKTDWKRIDAMRDEDIDFRCSEARSRVFHKRHFVAEPT